MGGWSWCQTLSDAEYYYDGGVNIKILVDDGDGAIEGHYEDTDFELMMMNNDEDEGNVEANKDADNVSDSLSRGRIIYLLQGFIIVP